jgi:hypothetical protein
MRVARRVFLSVGVLAALGCGEQRRSQTPSLGLTPDNFSFSKLAPGLEEQDTVEIYNRGSGQLVLRGGLLEDRSTATEFTLQIEDENGALRAPAWPEVIAGSSETPLRLVVTYRPTDDDARSDVGDVLLETNDPDALNVRLPILTGGAGPEIQVNPTSIDFGGVDFGESRGETLTITNTGVSALVISGFSVSGSPDFSVVQGDRTLGEALGDAPVVVEPGATQPVEVVYAPGQPGPDQATLVIASNDAASPQIAVNLSANGAAPCIEVTPADSVDFGSALKVASTDPATPTPHVRAVSIASCGGSELKIFSITIEGGDDTFSVADAPMPTCLEGETAPACTGPLFSLPALTPDAEAPSRTLQMEFRPVETRAYGGRLRIRTNANPPDYLLDLFGRGVDNSCPIPVAQVTALNVQPLDIIDLDGTPSSDPEGTVQEWQWTVVSRPDGSRAQLVESFTDPTRPVDGGVPDDVRTPTAKFFIDLAGHYEFDLVVRDNLGQLSCDPVASARVTVDAIPEKDLHIQLVWTTPDDPDETDDKGTDVDLHLRHSAGGEAWNDAANGYDCYYSNKEPDWGRPNDPLDNPSLDIDDTNGGGPENINLGQPEVGVTYDIGALYFRAESSFGQAGVDPTIEHAALTTVRVYVRGELLAEWLDRELVRRAQLWRVAAVEWCEDFAQCPRLVVRDEVLEEADYVTR